MSLPEPDGERIVAVIARARPPRGGSMDRATWLELNREFLEASHGQLEMPFALSKCAKSEWFDDLKAGLPERVV